MNISQEILVLDFGDEKREFFKADPSTDFAKGKFLPRIPSKESNPVLTSVPFHSVPFPHTDKTVTIIEPCPTKTSVLALAVTCALMILLYISTLFCYYMKKWMQPHKIVA